MDNLQQIEEIVAFRKFMRVAFGITLGLDEAAIMWVRRYAKEWRESHTYSE